MPKRNEALDKKTKEEFKSQIIEEINTTVKPDIINEVVFDIKKSIDSEYKNQIKNEITEELTNDIKKNIQKEEKKLSRRKSWKIFRLYIYILLLISCAVFLIYRLYKTDNLDVINSNITKKTKVSENTTIKPTSQIIKDLNYYTERYGYLLDNIKISNVDLVKGDILVNNMSIQDKLAMSYAILEEQIINEGSIYTILEDDLKNAYEEIFGNLDGYEPASFSVLGLNFVYSISNNSYIAIGEIDNSVSYVNNHIINIYEEENTLVFETKSYIVKNNNIYSVNNLNYRIASYSENFDITKVQNRLSTTIYKFTKVDDEYHISSITKK